MKLKILTISLMTLMTLIAFLPVTKAATLVIHPSGHVQNTHYLCVYSSSSCYNLKHAANGRQFQVKNVDFTHLNKMVLLDRNDRSMSTKDLYSSCQTVKVDGNNTVHVNVHVTKQAKTGAVAIKNLSCTVR